MKKLSLVVPMYNEGAAVPQFFSAIIPVLEACEQQKNISWEIIAIDDGSRDETEQFLLEAAQKDPRIRAVIFSRNFGKEAAMSAGLRYATGDAVIPIDADLQHPPDIIPQLVDAWQSGVDMVIPIRTDRQNEGPLKRFTSGWFYKLFNVLCSPGIPENAGDYRLMDRKVVDSLLQLPETNRFMKGLFAWVGFRTSSIPYVCQDRTVGESKWNYLKLLNYALDGITSFSVAPLRLLLWAGLAISLGSFVFGMLAIFKTLLFGESVSGYPTLIVAITFFGGVQLLGLGIIGEYLGRMYMESKRRPLYIVKNVYNEEPEHTAQS